MTKTIRLSIKVSGILIILAGLIWVEHTYHISTYITPARIEGLLAEAGMFAPVVFIAVMAASVIISPLPSLPLDILAGSFFGPSLGTLYAALGALLGAVISFLIARFFGRELIERVINGHINFCQMCSDKLLVRVVFVSRLIPGVSFDLVSYGAGLTKMSLTKFSMATFFGMLPLTYVYVAFGAVLINNSLLAIGGGLILVVGFFALPRWIEKYDLLSMSKHFRHDDHDEGHSKDNDEKRREADR